MDAAEQPPASTQNTSGAEFGSDFTSLNFGALVLITELFSYAKIVENGVGHLRSHPNLNFCAEE